MGSFRVLFLGSFKNDCEISHNTYRNFASIRSLRINNAFLDLTPQANRVYVSTVLCTTTVLYRTDNSCSSLPRYNNVLVILSNKYLGGMWFTRCFEYRKKGCVLGD
jgi:hypothetical protein